MEAHSVARVSTPLGVFTIRSSERGIREITFGNAAREKGSSNGQQSIGSAPGKNSKRHESAMARARTWSRRAAKELQGYATGQRRKFSVPLDLQGTPFQQKVWKALQTIPYGETRSYGQIARQVGNPRAARAVGMANHDNPIAVVVPCHRVIAGDGSLGGYAGGLRRKQSILDFERANA